MNFHCNLETLNAYVDGELSARDNAEVANAVSLDRELARQVATLSSLKATTASAGCSLEEPIDLDVSDNEKTWLPWAAAFLILIASGAGLATFILSNSALLPAQGLQLAEEIHKDWLRENSAAVDRPPQQITVHDPGQLLIDAYVPDLTEVNLAFSGVRRISSGEFKGMHIGYQGPHGCKVSLVVLNNAIGLSAELAHFERGKQLLYGWQVKQMGYYLLAYKMDPARLAAVARVVNKLTRERLPLDPESVIALKEARSSSKPCVA